MLLDVLTRICEDSAMDLVAQRPALLRLANRAAKELYQELDCNRIKREISVIVPANKLVALPTMVGELRGMRQHTSEWPVPLEPMSPRYVSDTLGYKWNNWRDIGVSPVHTLPASIDTLTFEAAVIEATNAVVTVIGQTNLAAREAEDVTIDASPKDTTKLFNPAGLKAIISNSVRNSDIVVKDSAGDEVAILYNNEQQTRYKMVDVSQLFYGLDTSDNETIVDILYKEPLYEMLLDSDEFPAGSIYDEAWHARAMALHWMDKPNRLNDSNRMRMASLVLLKNIKDGSEHGIVKKVTFGRNKYYDNCMVNYDTMNWQWT